MTTRLNIPHTLSTYTLRSRIQGFNAVELLIVLAIMSLLAALAVPYYRTSATRAKISDILAFANTDKHSINEYYQLHQHMPKTAADSGLNTDPNVSAYIDRIRYLYIAANKAQFNYTVANLGPFDAVGNITFQATGQNATVNWHCSSTIPLEYLPATCKG